MSAQGRTWLKILAGVLYAAAVGLVVNGFYTTYTYGSGNKYDTNGLVGHVVVGDAYNYQIIALWGIGWILAGLTCAVIASTISIVTALRSERTADEPIDYRSLPVGNVPQELQR